MLNTVGAIGDVKRIKETFPRNEIAAFYLGRLCIFGGTTAMGNNGVDDDADNNTNQ